MRSPFSERRRLGRAGAALESKSTRRVRSNLSAVWKPVNADHPIGGWPEAKASSRTNRPVRAARSRVPCARGRLLGDLLDGRGAEGADRGAALHRLVGDP